MKVSIVTAAYNDAVTIGDTLASVAAQTYADIEHVVVDGGSTDGTVELAREAGAAVTSEPDDGLYDALNKGLSRSSGDVVGFLAADDFLAGPGVVAALVAAFDDSTSAVYGNLAFVSRDDPQRVLRRWRSSPWTPAALRRGWMPPHPTLYMRRSVFDAIGGFESEWRVAADYDHVLRAFTLPDFSARHVDVDVVVMRLGGTSTRVGNWLDKWREDTLAARRNGVGGVFTVVAKNLRKAAQLRAAVTERGRR